MFLYVCLFCLLSGSLQLEKCRSYLNVRLQGTKYAGRLEVCYSQRRYHFWMPVCDGSWSNIDAGVVCRQLNFTNPAYQGLYTKVCCFCLSVCMYVRLSVSLSVCMSISLSLCLSVWQSDCLSVSVTVCLSVCLFISVFICLFVYLSDFLPPSLPPFLPPSLPVFSLFFSHR